MKKFLALVVAILAVSLYSCGKDEKKVDEKPVNPFVGSWKLEEYIDRGENKTDDCRRKSTIVFTENRIIINGHYTNSSNSCIPETIRFAYRYTDGKINNIIVIENGNFIDDITEFTIENEILSFVRIIDKSKGLKQIEKYKKQ